MAEQKQDKKIGFKSVQLFRDQILGIGSYGKVCKAECDGLLCAAKLIHETLVDPTAPSAPLQREHRLPIRRFQQECEFLSSVRHPNIVQYLGVYQDPDTHFPLILMELMDNSLTRYLESLAKPIPYHVQVNICHDIALALTFLHSNGIVHRDLSSNNVLVIGNNGIRAKVTDFGMARLGDQNPRVTQLTFTMCPGTDVYMPPEAVKDKPVYTEKIDCFSFGVIAVQIMTQLFPQPGDRRKEMEIEHVGLVEKRISECERRQNHISKIDPNHPLLVIALKCLKDKGVVRPSARELCREVGALKRNLEYEKSAQEECDSEKQRESISLHHYAEQINNLQSQIVSLEATIEQKGKVIAAKLLEINQLRERSEKEPQLSEREKDGEVNEPMRQPEETVDKQVGSHLQPVQSLSKESKGTIKLQWREGVKAPCEMSRYFSGMVDAVVDGNVVYVMEDTDIYAYSASTSTWSRLPNHNFTNCSSVIVNSLLTLIGGVFDDNIIGKLFSLTKKGEVMEWTEEFPPMPTKRWGANAICIKTALIVAGGQGNEAEIDLLTTIEVMNTQTHHWSRTAIDLPQPTLYATLVYVKGCIYVLGGYSKTVDPIRSVYKCSLSSLLRPPTSGSWRVPLATSNKAPVWSKVADIPVERSTYLTFCSRILAIGGVDSRSRSIITEVHAYNPSNNTWEVVSHMTTPRQHCFAASLPDNQLIVIGGETDTGEKTNAVEIATFV